MLFESDEPKTYPGRKFVQLLQVGLVIAIGGFIVMALVRPDRSPTPEPTAVAIVASTVEPNIFSTPAPTSVPDNPAEDLYAQAWQAHHDDDHELGIELYTQVLELDPTMANAWLGRAVAYEQTGADARLSRNDFWRYIQHMQMTLIERDIAVNESLALEMVEGRVYALSFEAQSGDVLDVTAKSVEKEDEDELVDPLLVLLLDDTPLQADDDTLRSDGTLINMDSHIETYKVTQDGTYTVLLSHAGAGSYGMIDITVRVR